jgi:hypothetical protein
MQRGRWQSPDPRGLLVAVAAWCLTTSLRDCFALVLSSSSHLRQLPAVALTTRDCYLLALLLLLLLL